MYNKNLNEKLNDLLKVINNESNEEVINSTFDYLYSVIAEFIQNADIKLFLERINAINIEHVNKIDQKYSKEPEIDYFLILWRSHAYLYIGEYNKALKIIKQKGLYSFEAEKYAQIISNQKGNFLDGRDLIYMIGFQNLSDFGKKHQKEIADVASISLNDFYEENGKNIFQYFLQKYNIHDLGKKDLIYLKKYFPQESEYLKCKNYGDYTKEYLEAHKFNFKFRHGLFRGAPLAINPDLINFEYSYIPIIISEALKYEIKRIYRESENIVREKNHQPELSKNWVIKTRLN